MKNRSLLSIFRCKNEPGGRGNCDAPRPQPVSLFQEVSISRDVPLEISIKSSAAVSKCFAICGLKGILSCRDCALEWAQKRIRHAPQSVGEAGRGSDVGLRPVPGLHRRHDTFPTVGAVGYYLAPLGASMERAGVCAPALDCSLDSGTTPSAAFPSCRH